MWLLIVLTVYLHGESVNAEHLRLYANEEACQLTKHALQQGLEVGVLAEEKRLIYSCEPVPVTPISKEKSSKYPT